MLESLLSLVRDEERVTYPTLASALYLGYLLLQVWDKQTLDENFLGIFVGLFFVTVVYWFSVDQFNGRFDSIIGIVILVADVIATVMLFGSGWIQMFGGLLMLLAPAVSTMAGAMIMFVIESNSKKGA